MGDNTVNKKWLYVLGGLSVVIYLLITLFFTAAYIEFSLTPQEPSFGLELVLFLAIFVIAIGCVVYSISAIVAFIGFIVAIRKRAQGLSGKAALLFFILTLLPIITEIIFIVCFKGLA